MNRFILLSTALSIALISSCTGGDDPENSKAIPQGNSVGSQNTKSEFSLESNDFEDTSVVKEYTANWQTLHNIDACSPDESQQAAGYYITNSDMNYLSASGGIRFYFGTDPDSPEKLHLILVGVYDNGSDSLNLSARTGTRNFSAPCPMICDRTSPLFRCATKGDDKIDVPSTGMAMMRLDSAVMFTHAWRERNGISNECENSFDQPKGYWVSRTDLLQLVPANSSYGMHLYFGIRTSSASEKIFLIATRAVQIDDQSIQDQFPNGEALVIASDCPVSQCACSVLSEGDGIIPNNDH